MADGILSLAQLRKLTFLTIQGLVWNHTIASPRYFHSCFILFVPEVLLEEVAINPTIGLPGGRSTNWRAITPKKFWHSWESSKPHNRLPDLGIWQRDWESPGKLTLKISEIWLQNFHRTGETETLRGQKQNLVCTRTQEKGAVVPQETEQDLPVRVLESPVEAWVNSDMPWGWGHWQQQSWEAQHAGTSPLKGGCHYPNHSSVPCQNTGQEHSPTHQQKIGLKIYWACPCPPEQDPVFPMASPIHQAACTHLLSSSIRGQREWKPQSCKTKLTDHMDHSFVWLNETMSHAMYCHPRWMSHGGDF